MKKVQNSDMKIMRRNGRKGERRKRLRRDREEEKRRGKGKEDMVRVA